MLLSTLTFVLSAVVIPFSNAQSTSVTGGDGYTGYNISMTGDPGSAIYATNSTPAPSNVSTVDPDVYLNASVYVGEINVLVANLTAKINIDAEVLSLLKFNAGVDVSIDRVNLLIQNISAQVTLEARLENLVIMVDDILKSLDLNPVLVALGQDLSNITATAIGALTGPVPAGLTKRDFPYDYDLMHNILYSKNDYTGRTHTNRVLANNGDILDQDLDEHGNVQSQKVVGHYLSDMRFNGDNQTAEINGMKAHRLEYIYDPFPGLEIISNIYVNEAGHVVKAQVLAETSAGGSSTIGDD